MDSLKEIFGVTRERPEVNHELKHLMVFSSRCYQSSLSELQPHFSTTVWLTIFFLFFFFFSANWLSIALTHFGSEKDSWLHIPDDISLTTSRHLVRWPTQYHLQCWTTEQLHKFPGKKKKKRTLVFTKDWMNNVASLLTYCSICWLGNNMT